jgi:hypothetical protein
MVYIFGYHLLLTSLAVSFLASHCILFAFLGTFFFIFLSPLLLVVLHNSCESLGLCSAKVIALVPKVPMFWSI